MIIESSIIIPNGYSAASLAGYNEENLRLLEKFFQISMVIRGTELIIKGEEDSVNKIQRLINELSDLWKSGKPLSTRKLNYILEVLKENPDIKLDSLFSETILTTVRGKAISPKTLSQREYINSIEKYDLVFGIGPAGTGKTYLAVAMAILALKEKKVSRIILTRPVVEAGENLGFLPGDMQAKVDPYFRPLYDALFEMIEMDKFNKLIERKIIEIAPLAYMRGRSLNDSFIILDESQNTSPEQLKMFLTRIGYGSKAVVTGDLTQIDLKNKNSGLLTIEKILKDIKEIKIVHFSSKDVVRNELVQKIVKAYEKYELEYEKSIKTT